MNILKNFFGRKDGLVTLEWVGIAAVVLLAGIAISFLVMEGADSTGGQVAQAAENVGSGVVSNTPDLTNVGTGAKE